MKKYIVLVIAAVCVLGLVGCNSDKYNTSSDELSVGDPHTVISFDSSSREYSVFTDPNVLWGSEEDFDIVTYFPTEGTVVISQELNELISIAKEENLVAFMVLLPNYCEMHSIDIKRLLIPDSLSEDAFLPQKIQEWNKATDEERYDELAELYTEIRFYVEEMSSEHEYLEFCHSWGLLESEGVRTRFVDFGFIPVYSLEFLYQREYSQDEVLTFIGTPEAILNLENEVTLGEIYILRLPNNPK